MSVSRVRLWPFSFALIALLAPAPAQSAELLLADFQKQFDPARVVTSDAKCSWSPGQTGLEIITAHNESWPGIALRAPLGQWDLTLYAQVLVRLKNTGTNRVTVNCRVDNPGADGTQNCVTHSLELGPGQKGTLRVPLKRTHDDNLGGKLFGMRGYPVAPGGPGTLDPAKVTQVLLFVSKPPADHRFAVEEIR